MANVLFNVAKGRVNELFERVRAGDPANSQLVVVLLKTVQSDANLIDYDDLASLLANAGNVECDFTDYARVTYGSGDIPATAVNDTDNNRSASLTLKSIASAGGALDNTILKSLICYDPDSTSGTDADLVPLLAHDQNITTNGQALNLPAGVVYQA